MSVDRYTKGILTVIAVCLVWLSFGGPSLLPAAPAQSTNAATEVVLTGGKDTEGVVWQFPPYFRQPTGTFVSDDARKNWERNHALGGKLPVSN